MHGKDTQNDHNIVSGYGDKSHNHHFDIVIVMVKYKIEGNRPSSNRAIISLFWAFESLDDDIETSTKVMFLSLYHCEEQID